MQTLVRPLRSILVVHAPLFLLDTIYLLTCSSGITMHALLAPIRCQDPVHALHVGQQRIRRWLRLRV